MIVKCKYGNYRVRVIVPATRHSEGLYRLSEENRVGWYGSASAIVEEIERREKVKQDAAAWAQFESLARLFIERSRR